MFLTKSLSFLTHPNQKATTLPLVDHDKILQSDIERTLYYQKWIKIKTNNTFDSTRILGIVAAGKGAENYLPYTIPKIIQQLSDIGIAADIIIGLNNGFECPQVIKYFNSQLDAQLIHLYTEEKTESNIPAKVFDNSICHGKPYYLPNSHFPTLKHRIFVIHQKQGLNSAGKIRVLGDIYSLLLNSIDKGWIPPEFLITFDAESEFLVETNYPHVQQKSNGLSLILKKMRNHPELDLVGTRNRFAIYEKGTVDGMDVLLPNFQKELPPIQWFINIVHGRYAGFLWKPGGGTVGRTALMISAFTVIAERYPGMRSEDTHLTILAEYAGFSGDILINVVSTNKTFSINDMTMDKPPKKAYIEQIYRWNAASHGLELYYGKHNVRPIASSHFPWVILADIIRFLKRILTCKETNSMTAWKKLKYLILTSASTGVIRKETLKKPDLLQGFGAKAYW